MQPLITKNSNSVELQMLKLNPSLMIFLKEGDLIDVALIEKANRAAFFGIPKIGTGIVYGVELINAKNILKNLKIGDVVTAKVLAVENENGLVELSLTEAGKQKAWQEIKEIKEKGEPIKVRIKAHNAGGLIAEVVGLQAFLPASQLSNEHYPQSADGSRSKILEALEQFVGEELIVKVLSTNPRTNKLIVSEREVIAENVKELLKRYSPGDVISGIVSGMANFGTFVRFSDNPELEGLIHISELSHNVIDHPKEVVKVGDMVQAKIIEIKDGRVSLSLKALQVNPWDKVGEKFRESSVVQGVVYRLNPFGAFIKLTDDIMGLIHVSEFGSVEELKKNLELGRSYQFLIESVKPADKRIVLKLTPETKLAAGSLESPPPELSPSEKDIDVE